MASDRSCWPNLWHSDPVKVDPSTRPALFTFGLWVGVFAALYLARHFVSEMSPTLGFMLAYVGVAVAVIGSAVFAATASVSRSQRLLGTLFAAGVVFIGLAWTRSLGGYALLVGAGGLVICAAIGSGIGRRVTLARYVWPLVIVGVGASLWFVLSSYEVSGRPVWERPPKSVLGPFMFIGPTPGFGFAEVIGLGDAVFAAFLLGAVQRCELSVQRAVLGLAVGFGANLAFLLIVTLRTPALVFAAPAVALALGRAVEPRWREVALGLGVVALLCGVGSLL